MSSDSCPVCNGASIYRGNYDGGERKRFSCSRCGDFEITRTALGMLGGKLRAVKYRHARLSHALRNAPKLSDEWFMVTSANIDELVNAPLPNIEGQFMNLVRWAVESLGDDRFGAFSLPASGDLAGMLGTVDEEGVDRLLRYARESQLVEIAGEGRLSLTPKGWGLVETATARTLDSEGKDSDGTIVDKRQRTPTGEIVRAHCNDCGGERNALVHAVHVAPGNDGVVSWQTTIEILECRGCDNICVRRRYWFSEWESVSEDLVTGMLVKNMPEEITYWQAKSARKRPAWYDRIADKNLRHVMNEVYVAIDHDLLVLVAIGARTLLDRAMFLKVGDPGGGFQGKLAKMVEAI